MASAPANVVVPQLKVDAKVKLGPDNIRERRIVAILLAHLEAHGFKAVSVDNFEEELPVTSSLEAMEEIFAVEEVWLYVRKDGAPEHGIYLILGEGMDLLNDWFFSQGDPDGFDACMEAFDVNWGA